jgi:hypothetical protein
MNYDYDYKLAFEELSENKKHINVVDIGAARGQFLIERLSNFFNLSEINSIGIDPLDHGIAKFYNKFFHVCVDNIPKNTVEYKDFYINEIDQASSLCKVLVENFTSNLDEIDKIYFTPDVLNRFSNIVNTIKVQVCNLNNILNSEFSNNEIIDIIKIDAEGKDFNIVKSIESNLHRIKFIAIECTSHKDNLTRFEGEGTKKEFIEFFKEKNFDIHYCIDHEYRSDNRTQASDITFINLNI